MPHTEWDDGPVEVVVEDDDADTGFMVKQFADDDEAMRAVNKGISLEDLDSVCSAQVRPFRDCECIQEYTGEFDELRHDTDEPQCIFCGDPIMWVDANDMFVEGEICDNHAPADQRGIRVKPMVRPPASTASSSPQQSEGQSEDQNGGQNGEQNGTQNGGQNGA